MKKMYNVDIQGVNTMITRIKEFRKKAKMTQESLANLTGITQGQISRIEKGETDIGIEQLCLFAKVFGVDFWDLVPKEIAPKQITTQERQLLDMIKKTVEPSNTDSSDTAKAE